MLLTWTVESREEVTIWNSYKDHVCFFRFNLYEEKNNEIESLFAETMLLLAELHPNRRRWLRRCDTSLQVHLHAHLRKYLLQPLGESLCQLFWLLQIGRIRLPQQCHEAVWGSKYSQYIVIYCHILSFRAMIASPSASFMSFSYILRTLMQFHCNLLYTHSPNAMIQEYIWIKELDISKSCTIIFTFCRIAAFFSPFYDWRCSKFLRCTEFWSGIEEKGISDLQFSAWIVVTIKLLTLTNYPSLWHSFFLSDPGPIIVYQCH